MVNNMKRSRNKTEDDDFGDLEYSKPEDRYVAWNLGGGLALLTRAKDAKGLEVGFKKKKN